MKSRKKIIILAILFIIAIGNFSRINSTTEIRTVEFLSIFALGAITVLFLKEVIAAIRNR